MLFSWHDRCYFSHGIRLTAISLLPSGAGRLPATQCAVQDLNLQLTAYEAVALTIELTALAGGCCRLSSFLNVCVKLNAFFCGAFCKIYLYLTTNVCYYYMVLCYLD